MPKKMTKSELRKLYRKYFKYIRAFLGWAGAMGLQVIVAAGGYESIMEWGAKRWFFALGVAALPGIVGFMKGGDDNPTDEELYERVHRVKMARREAKLEVTDPNGIPLPPAAPAQAPKP